MLLPKRVKHRRQFRGSMAGKATRGNKITNGEFGIVATEPCWIKSNQIEAARVAMTRYIKRGGKVFIKIFPDKPSTAFRLCEPCPAMFTRIIFYTTLFLSHWNHIFSARFPSHSNDTSLILSLIPLCFLS